MTGRWDMTSATSKRREGGVDATKSDVFISHASEDKDTLVRPLAKALAEYGVRVWYDEFTLRVGDSLSRSIDKGLSGSRFGVVILSRAFFKKAWPEYELRGLNAKAIGREKVILPVWYGVAREDVLTYSPTLADTIAIRADDISVDDLALEIVEVVRPEIFERIHKRLAHEEMRSRATVEMVETAKIKMAPPAHERLPDDLLGRIRLIRAALLGPYAHSMKFWVDGFRADMNPTDEIRLWERVAAVYLEYIQARQMRAEEHKIVFRSILAMSSGQPLHQLPEAFEGMSAEDSMLLKALFSSKEPVIELQNDEFPSTTIEPPKDWAEIVRKHSHEDFA